MTAAGTCRSLALAALLCGLVGSATVLTPAHRAEAAFSWSSSAGRVNSYEATLLGYVNSARQSAGRGPLTMVPGATDVARRWTTTMAASASLRHNPSLAPNIAAAGSPNWKIVSENVGYGSACDPKQLFDAYMASAHHKANILDPAMRYVGIGVSMRPAADWPCGQAWNTMDFVDSYTNSYGASRNPPQGMPVDAVVITRTQSVGTFENGPDARAVTGLSGGGLWSSAPLFDAPSASRDDSMHWSVAQTSSTQGWGSLYLRDALDLRNVRQIRITVQAVTPTRRSLPISVTVFQEWGSTATLGTVTADSTIRTFTLTMPAGVRGFDNNLRLTMANSSLSAVSPTMSQRRAYISVYGIDAVV